MAPSPVFSTFIQVDWDMDLTEEEIALVRDPRWRASLVFKAGERR